MALSRLHTWAAGEVLTASDLNAEFSNITDNLSTALSGTIIAGTAAVPGLGFIGDTDTGIFSPGANRIGLAAGGVQVFEASAYTSGVNFVLVAPGQSGQGAVLAATGSDTFVPLFIMPKGTGYVRVPAGVNVSERFYPGLGVNGSDNGLLSLTTGTLDLVAGGRRVLRASSYDNATNYVQVVPAQAGQPVAVEAAGADSNVALMLRGKGTGYVTASSFVLENFAATQSPTITGRAYWQNTEGSVHISAGTLMARVPALTNLHAGKIVGITDVVGVGSSYSQLSLGTNLTLTGTTLSASAGLKSIQVFTATGTWTRPADVRKVLMQVVGAGGGGSGCVNSGDHSGAGGGGGGTAEKLLDVSAISSSTVAIGAGGTAGAAQDAGGGGGTGGPSSWADGVNTITGNGGGGGTAAGGAPTGGAGGTATNGDINTTGEIGGSGRNVQAISSNPGGSSLRGFGGAGAAANQPGNAAVANSGGGGSGAYWANAGVAQPGGAGGSGIVVVYEY